MNNTTELNKTPNWHKKMAGGFSGLMLIILVGTPILADDTELLLSIPNTTGLEKPNILFILDSSGSMQAIESTQEPYDQSITYPGSCASNKYYWARSRRIAECRTDDKFSIDQDQYFCAQGVSQIEASGAYTDIMAQYRDTTTSGYRWRRLNNASNGPVECAADSGIHGENSGDQVYAQIGTDKDMYTSDVDREVAWGSSPTDRTYTVYDPNYLNWYHSSPITEMSRNEIVKAVTKNLLGSITNVNVGLMEFDLEEGGPVRHALKDLDSNRSEAMSLIDNLGAEGWTPLSETIYESALYWQGLNVDYGGIEDTDPSALESVDPMVYQKPTTYACTKNYNVILTDGSPSRDIGAYEKVDSLPSWSTTLGHNNCTGGNNDGACLDDISLYLSKKDIDPSIPGDQTVTTYTIGFNVDLPILKETAELTGGQYYLAEDVKTLTTVLTNIVTNILDEDVSFTAPTVSVNAFNRTQHLNDLYISVFRPTTTVHWPGNIKKFSINGGVITDAIGNPAVDTSTGFFSDNALNYWSENGIPDGGNVNAGGAVSRLPNPITRKIFSNLAGSNLVSESNQIATGNNLATSLDLYGLQGTDGEPDIEDLVEWIRGVDVQDIDNNPSTYSRRQIGDTLHSQPAAIVYGGDGSSAGADVVVYAATNDGYLHAIDGQTGIEMWSFIPSEFLPDMVSLYEDEVVNYKHYGIDGDLVPIVVDRNENGTIEVGTDFVYLIFGLRRGGNNYYALDVTNKQSPELKWIKTYDGLGQSWSTPVATRIDIENAGQSSSDDLVLVIGGGYDTVHDQATHPQSPDTDGAAIFVVDIETGEELWRTSSVPEADLILPAMTRSIPSAVRVLDMSGDGFADRMYAADLGGQIWRFDILNGSDPADLVTGGVIAQFGAEGTGNVGAGGTRRFFSTPDVALAYDPRQDKRFLAINLGSGYRSHPLDNSANDRFYALRDKQVFTKLSQTAYDQYPVANDGDMIEVSGQINVVLGENDRGWKLTLPANEKILAESRTFNDVIYFVSFEPSVDSSDPCRAGLSTNRLYRMNIRNGDPAVGDLNTLIDGDPGELDQARATTLEQGGIAVRPVFFFPSPADPDCEGSECTPPPLGCIGVECFDPGFSNKPVRTLWTQNGVN
ncbi:MAG: hypothetical protein CMO98_10795 [Woeseia sp.]|nr:hypothetical protein [Woeseia sp.]